MKEIFSKVLSANDVGTTGAHQAGILVPKTNSELLTFLPFLDPSIKNPDAWIEVIDENGIERKFRFVYYNNKIHESEGTRNEYRITHMTNYFRDVNAKEDDVFEISKEINSARYTIRVIDKNNEISVVEDNEVSVRIKIRTSWSRVH